MNLMLISAIMITIYVLLGIFAVIMIVLLAILPLKLWFIALISGAHVSMARLIGMKLRKNPLNKVIESYIRAKKAGLTITIVELETHTMAGGDVQTVIDALIAAHSAKIPLSTGLAMAIDLAGRNVVDAVRWSVKPKVIVTEMISAVAKDGIELKVKAKVTVKANIQKFIGSAGEETIIARVGEGIVSTVGSALYHSIVLEKPDLISKTVLNKGLDAGTAYSILSIDIADVDVGDNIGAKLLMDRADADKSIAQAKAEERRSMALATEQEMRSRTQEMQAMLVAAQAEVPKALADSIKTGKIGFLDYYKIQNLVSDTAMRNAIASSDNKKKSEY